MNKLRTLCFQSDRLNNVDYTSFKKEIGAIEIHEMEDYFLELLDSGIKCSNPSNSIVAYLLGITDEAPKSAVKWKGGTTPD